MSHIRRTALLLPLLILCSLAPARATVMRALVAEVRDGASVVVISNSRRLTVILKGVDAPRAGRDAELARRHLASLILGREVVVEYTELRGGCLYGRVFSNSKDVGLQVIRDGAAWYDPSPATRLGEAERRVYAESERAARRERRGVWQEFSATSSEIARAGVSTPGDAVGAGAQAAGTARRRALSSEDLLTAGKLAAADRTRGAGRAETTGGARGSATRREDASAGKPTQKPLNTSGEDYDFQQYLTQGRTSVVYFYADWCPACRSLSPVMSRINSKFPDMQVLFMDIRQWGSPVAEKYGVRFVPYLQIYDEGGALLAEGRPARDWLARAVRERERAR